MLPINYKEINDYEGIEICGLRGLFTNYRIERKTLPEHLKALSIREGDDYFLGTLEEKVLVNHIGDFLTAANIETKDFYLDIDGNYTYLETERSNELKYIILNLL